MFNFVAMLLLVSLGIVNYGLSSGRITFPAHMTPFEPLDLNGEDTYAQRWKIWRTGYDGDYCQQAIVDSGARVKVLDDQRFSPACSKIDVVEMAGLSQAAMKPLDTKCAVAVQTYLWERRVVQPAAQKHFGIPVSEVLHFGSYNCRTMRGSNRMSQHARANAIDVSGFRLKNGRVISLVKDWNGSEEERAFLREVRDGACDHFTAVLGPEFNALHADHFHFDLGWWPKCK
ncbi:MAG: extensin family protein [Pseudomonadota bacterium]